MNLNVVVNWSNGFKEVYDFPKASTKSIEGLRKHLDGLSHVRSYTLTKQSDGKVIASVEK